MSEIYVPVWLVSDTEKGALVVSDPSYPTAYLLVELANVWLRANPDSYSKHRYVKRTPITAEWVAFESGITDCGAFVSHSPDRLAKKK
jgi:hypothetical protein